MGFDAQWGVLGAADVGANHQRNRIWIVAKWRGQLSHAQYNRIGRWEQQQKSIEKEKREMAYTNNNGHDNKEQRELSESAKPTTARQKFNKTCGHNSLANSSNERLQGGKWIRDNNKKNSAGFEGAHGAIAECNPTYGTEADWWHIEPNVGRVADGVAARVDRLKAIGNGQVPLCAAEAWKILSAELL
jgi:DNA (cytosine-5)-methyltransferase 1